MCFILTCIVIPVDNNIFSITADNISRTAKIPLISAFKLTLRTINDLITEGPASIKKQYPVRVFGMADVYFGDNNESIRLFTLLSLNSLRIDNRFNRLIWFNDIFRSTFLWFCRYHGVNDLPLLFNRWR